MTTTDFFDVPAGEVGFQVARGRLLNVTSENAGTWLAADITIGATTLTFETEVGVGDEFVFDTGEIVTILTVTPDTDGLTATVALPVSGDHSEGEHLSSWPLKSYPLAMVSISELDDDPVQALIPAALQPFLAEGPRTDADTEFVVIERNDQDERWWVREIPGEVAIVAAGGITPGDMPVGSIIAWTSTVLPARWLLCDGAAVSRTDFADLFTLVGTLYGVGDGSTTFNLPNLTGKAIQGAATPGASGGVATHTHGFGNLNTASQAAHAHASAVVNVSSNGSHSHGNGSLAGASNGGHGHSSAGGHDHSVGGPTVDVGAPSGSFWQLATSTHSHNVGSASGHSHGSVGDHTHAVSGTTAGIGDHSHNLTGNVGDGGSHAHALDGGATGSTSNWPPYLALIYIIKAVPGGDPAVEGQFIEVRDEGVPDVPIASSLDFRGAGVDVVKSGNTAVVTIGAQAGVTDHGALTGLADDDHPQYLTNARGDARYSLLAHAHAGVYEPAGAIATHAGLADPHPGYLTPAEGAVAYEPAGSMTGHLSGVDAHPGYALDSEVTASIAAHTSGEPHAHPDLATHDSMGLATQAELNAHGAGVHTMVLDQLQDVNAPSPTAGQLLGRVGTEWQAVSPSAGSHPTLAEHDTLGLATQAELDALAATVATDAELAAGLSALIPPGTMVMTMRSTAPAGWLMSDGSFVSQTTYAALFAAIGHNGNAGVNPGDGTFRLPRMNQRFPLGKHTSGTGAVLGDIGGEIDHTHGPGNLGTAASSDIGPNATTGSANRVNNAHNHDVNSGATGAKNPQFTVVNYLIKT